MLSSHARTEVAAAFITLVATPSPSRRSAKLAMALPMATEVQHRTPRNVFFVLGVVVPAEHIAGGSFDTHREMCMSTCSGATTGSRWQARPTCGLLHGTLSLRMPRPGAVIHLARVCRLTKVAGWAVTAKAVSYQHTTQRSGAYHFRPPSPRCYCCIAYLVDACALPCEKLIGCDEICHQVTLHACVSSSSTRLIAALQCHVQIEVKRHRWQVLIARRT